MKKILKSVISLLLVAAIIVCTYYMTHDILNDISTSIENHGYWYYYGIPTVIVCTLFSVLFVLYLYHRYKTDWRWLDG